MNRNCHRGPGRRNGCATLTRRTEAAFTLVELLVVLGIIVVLLCLMLPAVRRSTGTARRQQCVNNIKQIAIAIQNYAEIHEALPPAYTTKADGKPRHSWRTMILPFMEGQELFESIDTSKAWDDPANAEASKRTSPAYQCPSSVADDNLTTYLAVVTPTSCFRATEPRILSDITDHTAQTFMLIEADAEHAVPWMSPVDADEKLVLGLGGTGSTLAHAGVMHGLFLDGHVEGFQGNLPATVRRALISIAGNEKLTAKGVE